MIRDLESKTTELDRLPKTCRLAELRATAQEAQEEADAALAELEAYRRRLEEAESFVRTADVDVVDLLELAKTEASLKPLERKIDQLRYTVKKTGERRTYTRDAFAAAWNEYLRLKQLADEGRRDEYEDLDEVRRKLRELTSA